MVLTHNEERNVEDCLRSLAPWVGETWVVDSGSTDRTREIARRYTDKVLGHEFGTYSRQRNWAQENLPLAYPWVFHIDADERVTSELACCIRQFFARGDDRRFNGAMVARRTVFMGRWIRHGGHYPVYHLRLFRHDRGRCEDRIYHQHFLAPSPVTRLEGDLIDIVAAELDTFSLRHLRWAGEEARELLSSSGSRDQVVPSLAGGPIARRRWLRKVAYARLPLFARAFAYFFYRYVILRGFLDGAEGLIFHFLQGCWIQFYIDAKVWELRRERSRQGPAHAP